MSRTAKNECSTISNQLSNFPCLNSTSDNLLAKSRLSSIENQIFNDMETSKIQRKRKRIVFHHGDKLSDHSGKECDLGRRNKVINSNHTSGIHSLFSKSQMQLSNSSTLMFNMRDESSFMDAIVFYFVDESKIWHYNYCKKLADCGAIIMPVLNLKVTHVVLPSNLESDFHLCRDHLTFIQQNPTLNIVTPEWIEQCLKEGKLINEPRYFISSTLLKDTKVESFKKLVQDTTIFSGLSFYIQPPKHECESFIEWYTFIITYCSGSVVDRMENIDGIIDFVVSELAPSTDLDIASQKVDQYVTTDYIMSCIRRGEVITLSSQDAPFYWRPLLFQEDIFAWFDVLDRNKDIKGSIPVFYYFGDEELRNSVNTVLKMFGCECISTFDSNSCDFILTSKMSISSPFLQNILQYHIPIVDIKWIDVCAKCGLFLAPIILNIEEIQAQSIVHPSEIENQTDSIIFESNGASCSKGSLKTSTNMKEKFDANVEDLDLVDLLEVVLGNEESVVDDEYEIQKYDDEDKYESITNEYIADCTGYTSEEFDEPPKDEEVEECVSDALLKIIHDTSQLEGSLFFSDEVSNNISQMVVNREMIMRKLTQYSTIPYMTQQVGLSEYYPLPNSPIIFINCQSNHQFEEITSTIQSMRWGLSNSMEDCTHIVYSEWPRNIKSYEALLALSQQKIMVTVEWLTACEQNRTVVPPEKYAIAHIWKHSPFEGWIIFQHCWKRKYTEKVEFIISKGGGKIWRNGDDLHSVTHILFDTPTSMSLERKSKSKEYSFLKEKGFAKEFSVTLIQDYLTAPKSTPMWHQRDD